MIINKTIGPRCEKNYYITQFTTSKDPSNTRKNLYFDIRYCEIELEFNENKIFGKMTAHIAGWFNLPQGVITTNVSIPGQSIENIQLINSNLNVDSDFQYGFPDASKIYTANFEIDQNDDDHLLNNSNSNIKLNATFDLNTSQLEGLNLDNEIVDKFISNIKNVSLNFDINLNTNNKINSNNGLNQTIYQIKKIRSICDIYKIDNSVIKSFQKNEYINFEIIFPNYSDLDKSFSELFYLKKYSDYPIRVELKNLKIRYEYDDEINETNEISLDEMYTNTFPLSIFELKNYDLIYDANENIYKFIPGNGHIYFEEPVVGYYMLNIEITYKGSKKNYTLINNFNYLNKSIKISYEKDVDGSLTINSSDIYEEIQEN